MTLTIAFLNVGNADCIVLHPAQNHTLVIDTPKSTYLRQWLLRSDTHHIESIYITHGHCDHLSSLQQLTAFLKDWFDYRNGTVGALYLPNDVYESIESKSSQGETLAANVQKKQKLFELAVESLRLWRKKNLLRIFRSERSGHPHHYNDLEVHILHPDAFFVTDFRNRHPSRINDMALVLRIDYGAFRILLPSDIEKEGLRDLISRCTDDDLHCHILKIPHHGAWHHDAEATESLFARANPELAILSVGNTNTYNHVQPGLFRSLLHLQQTQRLQHFLCTEVTRTCVYTAQERADMKRTGLPSRQACAGDIVVEANQSGTWAVCNLATHQARVDTIERAACRGRADLREYPAHLVQT